MTASYPLAAVSVNPLSSVSTGAASLYRWFHRWHGEGATVEPHTRYLAAKMRKSERTIYRWLAELTAVEAVACEVTQGISRRILPRVEPLPVCKKSRQHSPFNRKRYEAPENIVSGVMSGVMSGVLPYDALDAENATTEAANVVRLLLQVGVSASTAAQLVKEQGEGECLGQIQALPFRKAVDQAAVLVASIRGRWSSPAGLIRQRDRQRSDAQKAAKGRAASILAAHRLKCREELENAFLGLSEAQKDTLKHRAEVEYRRSHPSMASRVLSLGVAARLLRGEMLRLLATEKGLEYA